MMYNKLLTTITIATLALTASAQTAQIPAFPGAEGHGRYTDGGRGGKVIHVTNLNDSGTGSLRAAVKGDSKKIIVFDVGGVIPLASDLVIGANTTIAGQTAPEPGITLRYYTVRPSANNVIRFIRVRRGQEKDINDGADAIWQRETNSMILDHCSFSWSIDEVASFYDNNNFTMQWCTIAESLVHPGHTKGAHGYGGIWGGKLASFHHNLIAHVANRSPRFNGTRYDWEGYTQNKYYGEYQWPNALQAENVDFRNCVVFNCGNGCYGGPGGGQINMVNNYFKSGQNETKYITTVSRSITDNSNGGTKYLGMNSRYYINGNLLDGTGKDWGGVKYDSGTPKVGSDYYTQDPKHYYGADESAYTQINGIDCLPIKLDSPAPAGEVTTHRADTAYEKVLTLAGASLCRDTVDRRYETETRSGEATYMGSATSYIENGVTKTCQPQWGRIDLVSDVNGYTEANFGTGSRPEGFDTDRDGIPDAWETANGLNPNDASDAVLKTIDTERGWYTNLEVYLNSLVEDIMKACQADGDGAVSEYYPEWKKPGEGQTEPDDPDNPDNPDAPEDPQQATTYSVSFDGKDIESTEGFFTYGGTDAKHNFNSKFAGKYNNVSFTKGLKMEGSTVIAFTTTSTATVTIVQSTWSDYSIKIDDSELTTSMATIPNESEGVRVYTVSDVPAGNHKITRGAGESGVLYVEIVIENATGPDPDPNPDPVITPGNVDGNETVDSGDVTYLIKHLLGQAPDDFVSEAADVNVDGEVNIADVTALIAKIIKGNDNNNENGDE